MKNKKIKIGISQGDINGISYEIIIKTLIDNRILEFCTPIVYGSPKVAGYHRKAMNMTNFSFNTISKPENANIKRANIINCLDDDVRVELGKSTNIAGNASFIALERAVNDLKAGLIDVLITAPINKKNIQSDKFKFPGHTEYLKEKFEADEVLMLLVSDILKVGVVAGHIPISEVASYITKENILSKLKIMNESLIQDFGIRKPKLAVLGLNPHAGDSGVIGDEEEEIIIPAIKNAREQDIMALGPYPADGFFGSDSFKQFDAILAMYHDQGLAPFKALVFDNGVNYTAGLPIIRTSPGHGTAYELAGKNAASPNSFRKALYLACDIYKKREQFKQLNSDVLQSYDNE
ncbi:MAG: 4-hydroxythreonine-4-phosphate dehydrogenase PdxA [Bacteroidales bacterium]|nr:4-hydroxythreonine-4-phosphate dehydrogenase PdxA [Bacteroidales bacterium]